MALPSAGGERVANRRNSLAEAPADAGQVRLDAVAHEFGVGRQHLHCLHVELFENLGLVACDVRGRRFVGRAHQQPRERLADPHPARISGRPSEADHPLHDVEFGDQGVIARSGVRHRPSAHVYAQWSRLVHPAHEVLVHGLGDERHDRRHQPVDGVQALVEGEIGGLLVPARRRLPEPTAVAPHVPVAELIHEGLERSPRREHVIGLQRVRRVGDRAMQQRERPAVDLGALGQRDVVGDVNAVELRVHHEERVGVPPGVDEPGRHPAHEVDGDALLHLRRDPARQVPAQGVRADVVEDVVRIHDVAERLRHLFAVLVHDVGKADAVAVRDAVGDQGRDGMERVKPAAGLVDGLAGCSRRGSGARTAPGSRRGSGTGRRTSPRSRTSSR